MAMHTQASPVARPVAQWSSRFGSVEAPNVTLQCTCTVCWRYRAFFLFSHSPHLGYRVCQVEHSRVCPDNLDNTKLCSPSRRSNHAAVARQVLCGHCTSAVSCPLIVIQMSRSLCLNPNPFLEEPNKLNLVPVRDIWKVITNYLNVFNFWSKWSFHESKIPSR